MPDADDMVVVVFLFLLLVLFARLCWSKKRKEKKTKTKTVVVPTCDILCLKMKDFFFFSFFLFFAYFLLRCVISLKRGEIKILVITHNKTLLHIRVPPAR